MEFHSKNRYDSFLKWLQKKGGRVVSVATTKRWGWTFGFLGGAKTYTVTYELPVKAPPVEASDEDKPLSVGCAVALILFIIVVAGMVLVLSAQR